jgi:uncharacterized protein YjaG (DUF416 family)
LSSEFADEMKKARKVGAFKEYIVGRSSEVTFSTAIEKYEGIIRYLAAFDYTGEVRLNCINLFELLLLHLLILFCYG